VADPTGQFWDTLLDVGFISWDIRNLIHGSECEREENLVALGLDIAGFFLPGVTGLGKGYKAVNHADDLLRQVRRADFSTPRNGAVFWTGFHEGNQSAAMGWAEANGKFTIEMTQGGKWLNDLNLFGPGSPISSAEADMIWREASKMFAGGASGYATAFTRGTYTDANRGFYGLELPILKQDVHKIVYRGY